MKRALIVAMAGLLVVSCGGETGETTTTIAETTTTQLATSTTTQLATSTTSEDTTTSTSPAPDIVISGGTADDPDILIEGPDLFSIGLGDEVLIRIQSAVAGELHVHGYDLFFDLVAGGVTEVMFPAEIPGIFEAELEGTHTLVFEIEVAP